MYRVSYDPKSTEFLDKIPSHIRKRILLKVLTTKDNPLRFFKRLEGREDFSLRVGDYRVLAYIDSSNEIINIKVIGHRKNIYEE